jgi:uncharacterized protein YdeI (BOF family)
MKKTLLTVAAISSLLPLSTAFAAAAPHSYHLTTVSWVVATRDNLDDDDRYVTLVGHVTGKDGDGDYFFTDGTATVRLDGEKFELPVGPKIAIGGRVDQAYLGFGHLEVDVRNWHYAKHP